jgi:hypothetical protein
MHRTTLSHLLIAGLLLCAAVPAAAQTTVVTGTVTDPNGLAYAGATVKAQLVLAGAGVTGQPTVTINNAQQCRAAGQGSAPCQVPFPGSVGPWTLDSAGSFTQNLQDNAQVTPAGTQWLFSVTISPGVLPPAGTGPQAFSATITITGASQSVSAALSAPSLALSKIAGVAFPLLAPNGSQAAPSYNFANSTGSGMYFNGATVVFASAGVNAAQYNSATWQVFGNLNAVFYQTSTKCAAVGSGANPSVAACSSAPAGVFSCATASGGNCTVNTTRATDGNSTILIWQDASTTVGTLLGVTCNTTISAINPVITARVAATSFSFSITTPVANPDCFQYLIFN